jgi:hypothetical protein
MPEKIQDGSIEEQGAWITKNLDPVNAHNREREEKQQRWIEEATEAARLDAEQRERKQAEWLAKKRGSWRAKINAACLEFRQKLEDKRAAWVNKAALDARLGFVRMIGMRTGSDYVIGVNDEEKDVTSFAIPEGMELKLIVFKSEEELLEWALEWVFQCVRAEWEEDVTPSRIISFYGHGFDFPFIIRRAWILGIEAHPDYFIPEFFGGAFRNYRQSFIDLCDAWKLGDYRAETGGLDEMARLLGVGRKPEGVTGKRFHELYREEPSRALEYLVSDLDLTWGIAETLQLTDTEIQ